MLEKIIDQNEIINFDRIDGEQDLSPKARIVINPPPPDGMCYCCSRHISELQPFGDQTSPLGKEFTGAYLVRRWRPNLPSDADVDIALAVVIEEEGFCGTLAFVVAASQSDGIDIAPVVFALGVLGGDAVDFGGGGLQDTRFDALGKAEHLESTHHAGLDSLYGVVMVVDR